MTMMTAAALRMKKMRALRTVLRFRKSERMLHWCIAIPFLVSYSSALILVFVYNPDPFRPYRDAISLIHRVSGVCFILFPLFAVLKSRRDYRIHFYNIKQAWIWVLDDVRWLFRMGLAMISKRITLPEQGKFNAAQKLNFMLVMSTYPLYVLTGVLIWLTHGAFVSWLLHVFMAVIALPFLCGHIFMATINPGTRQSLQGMISGLVDRQWVKEHHRRWYRENFPERQRPVRAVPTASARRPAVSSARRGPVR